jgi:hypothetical protein
MGGGAVEKWSIGVVGHWGNGFRCRTFRGAKLKPQNSIYKMYITSHKLYILSPIVYTLLRYFLERNSLFYVMGGVNCAVYYVVQKQKALITVLSVGIKFLTLCMKYGIDCTVLLYGQVMGFRTFI